MPYCLFNPLVDIDDERQVELNSDNTQQMSRREHKHDSDILTWFLQALNVKTQKDAIIDALQEHKAPNAAASSRIKKI